MKSVAAILIAIVTLSGCQTSNSGVTGSKTTGYGIVVDYSASTDKVRKQLMGVMLTDLEQAPAGSTVTVFRMGRQTDEVYSGVIDENTIDAVIAASIRDMGGSDPRPGTDFAAMAEALNGWASLQAGKRIRILVLTDGVNDFATDTTNRNVYAAEAAKLTKNPALESLVFAGVETGWREDIRRAFHTSKYLKVVGQGEPTVQ